MNPKKIPREMRDVMRDWFTFKAAAERPGEGVVEMNVMQLLELGTVDQDLADRFVIRGLNGEEWRSIPAANLAARIRGRERDESGESEAQHLERAAAYIYGRYHGDSLEEARALLDRYLELLDAGHRPLLGGDLQDLVPRPA